MKKLMSIPLMGLAMASVPALAVEYFNENFSGPIVTGPTQAPSTWYPDRYVPNQFDSVNFLGDDRLRIRVVGADGVPPNGTPGRIPSLQGTFYNTQGRKYDLGNPVNSYVKAQQYVAGDWATRHRRSDIWATLADGSGNPTAYAIAGIANTTGTPSGFVCRVYDADTPLGWVDVSSLVPGGVTAGRWYNIEIRALTNSVQYLVDGVVVYTDSTLSPTTVQVKEVMLQAYNFNDPLLASTPAFNDSYDAYWDNLSVGSLGTGGMPVDLNGSYTSPSSGPQNPSGPAAVTGLAVASTGNLISGSVFERNGSATPLPENAQNGVFTPFNDMSKIPSALNVTDADGTSLEFDVELGGDWKPFQWGQGVGNPVPFATGDTFNVGWANGSNSFGAQVVTNLSGDFVVRLASVQSPSGALGALDPSAATLPAGTTKARINLSVLSGFLQGTVTPLDGPSAFVPMNLGSTNGLNLNTNVPWALNYLNCTFVAGFETHEHTASAARAKVSSMTTDALKNVLFLFANDPYVRTADGVVNYRVGQANLLQLINGYQAFMMASPGQGFGSGTYVGPYTTFNPPVITGVLDAAAAAAAPNLLNTDVVNLNFLPGGEGIVQTGFRPNMGAQNNLFAGGPPTFDDVMALTRNSNQVVIDNTNPVLSAINLSGSAWVSPNVIPGLLNLTVNALDAGVLRSGLETRPTGMITWANASTTPLVMASLTSNLFQAAIPIGPGTPNGTATATVDVCDRAGNCTTQTTTFNVSTVNVTVNLAERGLSNPASRVVTLKFGGTGGLSAPISLKRVVNFNTPVSLPEPSHAGATLVTYQDLDMADNNAMDNSVNPAAQFTLFYAKDNFFSLGKQEPMSGTPGAMTGSAILRLGDVTDNNVINVSDLAVWAAFNGTAQSGNTTLAQLPTPRQVNLDGSVSAPTVGLADRNLIVSAWLFVSDNDLVGNFRDGGSKSGSKSDGSQTIKEVVAETGLSVKLVTSMDANGDGRITREEVLAWRGR